MQGFQLGHLPSRLKDKDVCLVIPGLFDLVWLSRALRDADVEIRENLGLKRAPGACTSTFLLLRLFNWVYLIRTKNNRVGLLGIYDWEPGQHAFLSVVIWSDTQRDRGIGSSAVRLAMEGLVENGLCKEFFVEVKECNYRGIRFWERNGFSQINTRDGIVLMCLSWGQGCQ